jgi:endonuclease III
VDPTPDARRRSRGVVADGRPLLAALERFYGPLPMPPDDPFRFCVWDVLSMQTTPARRDAALAALQRLRALTPDAMWRAPRGPLESAVLLAGPYSEQRLSALRTAVERFRRDPRLADTIRGPLRGARRSLSALTEPAGGRAHRLLLFAGGHCVQPVDSDVLRFWRRLTGVPEWAALHSPHEALHPRQARRAIEAALPREVTLFRRAALYLRHHATQTCAQIPHCTVCPLQDRCGARADASPAGDLPAAHGRRPDESIS